MNQVSIIGRLTRDPELRQTQGGTSLCKVGIAVNHNYTVNGEKCEEVSFFNVTFWGRLAEIVNHYCRKGKQIAVVGELHQDRWEKDGKTNSRIGVNCNSIQLIGSNGSSSGATGGKPSAGNDSVTAEFPDDIPFDNF